MTQRIPLDKGMFALVDDQHYTLVSPRKWHAREFGSGIWYARTNVLRPNGRKSLVDMHRFIMNAISGQRVDHRDGDGLNNTSGNLRFCTHQENMRNRRAKSPEKTSRYKGVCWHKSNNGWVAQIKTDERANGVAHRYLGTFSNEEEAALAYDAAAIVHFGEFAATNFSRSAAT